MKPIVFLIPAAVLAVAVLRAAVEETTESGGTPVGDGKPVVMSMIEETTTTMMTTLVPDLMNEDSSSSSGSAKRKTRSVATAERAVAAPVIGTPQRVRRAGSKKTVPVQRG
jgi:hypothetical protein